MIKKLIVLMLFAAMMMVSGFMIGCKQSSVPPNGGTDVTDPDDEETIDPDEQPVKTKIKVYLIAGQSNALGCTTTERLEAGLTGARTDVLFYANGEGAQENYDNHAAHNRWTHVVPGFGVNGDSFGLESGMSDVLSEFYPAKDGKEQVAIIKYAWGGTGLAKRWLTKSGYPHYANSFEEGGRYVGYNGNTVGDLYAEFLMTVETATAQLEGIGYIPEYAGLAWMQGCDDACTQKNGSNYESMLRCFIADVREDLGVSRLPVAIGQINVDICPFGDAVRKAQHKVAQDTDNCMWIYTRDLQLKPDDWWHFDSPDMYEMGKRFASELVLKAECPKIISIEDFSVNVSGGATLFTRSATEINLPTYAKARTESGKKLYVPIVYENVPDDISSERLVVDVAYGGMRAEAAIIPQNDPVVDGRIDESIWASVRAYPISDKGSVIRVYQGEAGIYLSAEIVDTSIMNQWYDGNAWDPYLENDQVKFYLHTGDRTSGTVDEHSYAIYLTASNVLRVYRGRSDGTWDAINHYGRYEEGYYKKYQHRVRIDGTPFNATDDIDRGYSMEIFIPYECLGDDVSYIRRNLKINAAYEDKKDYEIPHTTYQLNGGMNEYDDLNIYLPYEVFCRAKKYAFDV